MTDALITNLARVRGLRRVISRTSVIPYKDTRKRLPQIAGELNVDGIIEGSVLRSGNQVRISVQLLHGPSDRHLWAREYERDLSDIVTLQREVAHAIVEEIRVQLTPEEKSQLTGTRPVNPEAYDAYVKGRYFWNKRSAEGLQKSIEYFQQAIALDPGYALAHAGLADTYNALSFFSLMPPKEASPRAKKAALRAIELDDTLAEAHAALADVAFHYDWDWQAAERGFRRANELNPNYATAHQWYGAYLALMGRVAESQAEFERAESLDPHSLLIIADATSVFYYSRRYDEALAQCRKSLELDPNYPLGHLWCGRAYLQKGMHPEAIAAFSKAVELQPGFVLGAGLRAHAQGVAGNRAEARRRIGQLLGQSQRVYVSPALISLAYWGVGDRAQALDWAERAYRERDGLLTRLKMDPALDEFRKDPQFRDLMRRIGLDAPAASPAQVPR
jgi:tetratricopeptide (TPR) repeat protein